MTSYVKTFKEISQQTQQDFHHSKETFFFVFQEFSWFYVIVWKPFVMSLSVDASG